MEQNPFLSWTTILGIMFILIGIAIIVIPLLARYLTDVEKIHPLLLVGVKLDGFYVGTSPILIIALVAIYLLLRYYS
ncbi:MAG: hypothetical protein QXH12_06835 [Candidatus Caldarchaeum sp.]|uniref:DUF2905 domain-containing protein n=1 Tax=Caldiarchaeum subterraneum TaxID=311458 RepID=A0A7C5LCJ1_CALS0